VRLALRLVGDVGEGASPVIVHWGDKALKRKWQAFKALIGSRHAMRLASVTIRLRQN
jgi:hypothetical protein